MYKEHDVIALLKDWPEEGLRAGDIGTIVNIHEGSESFLVEFSSDDAHLVALVGLRSDQVRPVNRDEPAIYRVVRV